MKDMMAQLGMLSFPLVPPKSSIHRQLDPILGTSCVDMIQSLLQLMPMWALSMEIDQSDRYLCRLVRLHC